MKTPQSHGLSPAINYARLLRIITTQSDWLIETDPTNDEDTEYHRYRSGNLLAQIEVNRRSRSLQIKVEEC
jgi:hypothetical protein